MVGSLQKASSRARDKGLVDLTSEVVEDMRFFRDLRLGLEEVELKAEAELEKDENEEEAGESTGSGKGARKGSGGKGDGEEPAKATTRFRAFEKDLTEAVRSRGFDGSLPVPTLDIDLSKVLVGMPMHTAAWSLPGRPPSGDGGGWWVKASLQSIESVAAATIKQPTALPVDGDLSALSCDELKAALATRGASQHRLDALSALSSAAMPLERRLKSFYQQANRSQIPAIPDIAQHYRGKEAMLFQTLATQYPAHVHLLIEMRTPADKAPYIEVRRET